MGIAETGMMSAWIIYWELQIIKENLENRKTMGRIVMDHSLLSLLLSFNSSQVCILLCKIIMLTNTIILCLQ